MSTSSSASLNTRSHTLRSWWAEYSEKVTASLEIKKQRGHLLVLDGVRAVACLAVLLHHIIYHIVLPLHWAGLWTPSGKKQIILAALLSFGNTGVFLFFLLSSFLLFLPFARALLFGGNWPSIARFYVRRFFRILPAYYLAIILMVLFFHPEFTHADHGWKLFEFFTFSMQPGLPEQLNGPFWTMAVEFQFYLLLPLIGWVLSLIVPRGPLGWRLTKLVGCILLLLGWGLLTRWWGLSLQPAEASSSNTILAVLRPFYYGDNGKYFESFALGMLLAMLYVYTHNAPNGNAVQIKLERWSGWMFLIGALATCAFSIYGFCIVYHFYEGTTLAFLDPYRMMLGQLFLQWQSLAFTLSYGLCTCALLYNTGWLKRPFEWAVLRWLGLISFSLYMWHLPFLYLFMSMMQHFHGIRHSVELIALFAWVCFVIIPVSLTLYRWIEMPGMRLGEMVVQKIERSKKNKPIDTSTQTPIQEATPPLVNV